MRNKKNMRRVSVLISAQKLWNLGRLAKMAKYGDTIEIVEPKMIPTVTQDGGSLPIVVPVISVLSLIGVLARLLI